MNLTSCLTCEENKTLKELLLKISKDINNKTG